MNDPAMLTNVNARRIENDAYYTIDGRCLDALMSAWFPDSLEVWEPACGVGHLSEGLKDFGCKVYSSDIAFEGYEYQDKVRSLFCFKTMPAGSRHIVSNPPFDKNVSADFIRHCIALAQQVNGSVAMLMRNEWDCAKGRRNLFQDHPAFHKKVVLNFRPKWFFDYPKGTVDANGEPMKNKSPRHNYSWFIWDWSKTDHPPQIVYAV